MTSPTVSSTDEVSRIVKKYASHDVSQRYQTALDLIADVERLEATPVAAPA